MLDNTISFQSCYGDILCTACRTPSVACKIERSGNSVVKVVYSGQDIQLVWNLHVVVLRCGLRVEKEAFVGRVTTPANLNRVIVYTTPARIPESFWP